MIDRYHTAAAAIEKGHSRRGMAVSSSTAAAAGGRTSCRTSQNLAAIGVLLYDPFGKYVFDSLTWQKFEKPESIREIFCMCRYFFKFSSSIKLHVNLVQMKIQFFGLLCFLKNKTI